MMLMIPVTIHHDINLSLAVHLLLLLQLAVFVFHAWLSTYTAWIPVYRLMKLNEAFVPLLPGCSDICVMMSQVLCMIVRNFRGV